jgi:hypothetical protein
MVVIFWTMCVFDIRLSPRAPIPNLRPPMAVDSVSIGVISAHRDRAFYLPDVVDAVGGDVVIFNTEIPGKHHSLERWQGTVAHHIVSVWNGFYDENKVVPYANLRTDVHKTRRYANVGVVKTDARKRWWRKENLDFLSVARSLRKESPAHYYLILEDDNEYNKVVPISLKLGFWINTTRPMVYLGESTGAILISDPILESFIGYMSLRADVLPVDWMLESFMESLSLPLVHDKCFIHVGKVTSKPF